MSFYLHCYLLMLFLMVSCLFAQEVQPTLNMDGKAGKRFLIFSYSKCLEPKGDPIIEGICKSGFVPQSLDGKTVQVLDSKNGIIGISDLQNSVTDDNLELLCYRCVLEKADRDTCGRYKSVWGDKKWIMRC